ncbi:17552_t:CDS:2 [Acaulospora morrowiae]|uniref:17552_t:CDS:1 n=1 Tax=Acaulospora morrowiae TaxID=94023 RepID=A0A9N9IFM1_9GLOM|nr:17552_t:CDS:2 [Acaulospora morrowiae]
MEARPAKKSSLTKDVFAVDQEKRYVENALVATNPKNKKTIASEGNNRWESGGEKGVEL